jgi:hypothetical protein
VYEDDKFGKKLHRQFETQRKSRPTMNVTAKAFTHSVDSAALNCDPVSEKCGYWIQCQGNAKVWCHESCLIDHGKRTRICGRWTSKK